MDEDLAKKIFLQYKINYVNIFEKIYPSQGSTGFTERNLSVNFVSAYKQRVAKKDSECIAWYEWQFGDKHNEHYDAVLIDAFNKRIYIIESKRYNNLSTKLRSVNSDINRIKNFKNEIGDRIPDIESYRIFGVILADVWTENTSSVLKKRKVVEQYEKSSFLKDNANVFGENSNLKCKYNVQHFHDCTDEVSKAIADYYRLLSLWWEII